MMYFQKSKSECTGCGACYNACPIKCIEMNIDEEGFLYPSATDKCIHCKKCESVCPQIKMTFTNNNYVQKAFAACSTDYKIWKRSASGGAFSEICKAFGDSNTFIVGAAWDKLYVKHIGVFGIDEIEPLCKSKYVASEIDDVLSKIEEQLKNGNKVIFCGTPCQVAGLKNYLGKDYDNLLTLDLICHGVGSPKVFTDCIQEMEKQYCKNIEEYHFRSKRKKYEIDYLAKIKFADDSKEKYLVNDQYIQLFLNQLCLRPSCGEHCIYRNANRQGDITIADFKGLNYVFPKLACSKKNYSTIVFNNEKGYALLSLLYSSMEMHECSISEIEKYNPLFSKHTWFASERDSFFEDYKRKNQLAIKKWTVPSKVYKKSVVRKVYDILPTTIRRIVWNCIRKNKNEQ